MYQNGVDIRTLQTILGHTSVSTTMIYTHIEDSSLREAAQRNPLSAVHPRAPHAPDNDTEQEENHEDT